MLPTIDLWTSGRSLFEQIVFLLSPGPLLFEQPILKTLLWGVHSALDLPYPSLILLGMLLHLANSGWVYRVGRQLGLSRSAGLLAGAIYLTSFAHFHAYFWPSALQHVAAVLTILLLLSLYLRVESQFREGDPGRFRLLYWTWGAACIGSLQRSTLVLPAVILADILFGSSDAQDRARRFGRWSPLFLIYPIYLLLGLIFVGDLGLSTALHKSPVPAGWKVAAAFFGMAGGLLGFRMLLQRCAQFPVWRMGFRVVGWGVLLLLPIGLGLRDHRQILLPYNAVIPWCSLFGFFLDPIGAVRMSDSTQAYYVLPPILNFFYGALALGVGWSFYRIHRRRHQDWLIPLVWYGVCLWYLMLHRHVVSSFPIRIPSRYFIYLSPVFAWLVADVAVRLFERVVKHSRLGLSGRAGLAVGLILFFTIPNILAVRLQLFRGKLTNSYFAYDDVRTADLIQQHLLQEKTDSVKTGGLAVLGVEPILFARVWGKFVPVEQISRTNAERLLRDRLRLPSNVPVEINPPSSDQRLLRLRYRLNGGRIVDADGRPAERFWRLWEEGSFRAAVEERPYLLNYLLGSCRLSDVRWMTDGRGLRDWILQIEGKWRLWSVAPIGKWERTREVMGEELSSYAGCFVGLSYEAYRQGREEEARQWLSQLYFLEPDRDRLREWLQGQEWMRRRPEWQAHLERLNDPRWFRDPLPWTKDDYGFGRFLVRLLFNADIRSRWDRGKPGFRSLR